MYITCQRTMGHESRPQDYADGSIEFGSLFTHSDGHGSQYHLPNPASQTHHQRLEKETDRGTVTFGEVLRAVPVTIDGVFVGPQDCRDGQSLNCCKLVSKIPFIFIQANKGRKTSVSRDA